MHYRDIDRIEDASVQNSLPSDRAALNEAAAAVAIISLIVAVMLAVSMPLALLVALLGLVAWGVALVLFHAEPDPVANDDTVDNAILDIDHRARRQQGASNDVLLESEPIEIEGANEPDWLTGSRAHKVSAMRRPRTTH